MIFRPKLYRLTLLSRVVAATVGYSGEISFDTSRPDGTPRKLLDVSRVAKPGLRASTSLEHGVKLIRPLHSLSLSL